MKAGKSIYRQIKKLCCSLSLVFLVSSSVLISIVPSGGVPAFAAPPTTSNFIYVNTDGFAGGTTSVGCTLFTTSAGYPPTFSPFDDNNCDLGEAINLLNNLDPIFVNPSMVVTIRFAESLTTINLERNLPAITYAGQLEIDGQHDSAPGYTAIRDNTADSNTLDYFFRVTPNLSTFLTQSIVIKKFAFIALKKGTAKAITTDDPTTPSNTATNGKVSGIEGAFLEALIIEDNFFGTRDGSSVDNANYLQGGVHINLYPLSVTGDPTIRIQNNNFLNTNKPIFVGTASVPVASVFPANQCQPKMTVFLVIENNTIGLTSAGTTPAADLFDNSGWTDKAINVCNLNRPRIQNNAIANSSKNVVLILFLFNTAIYVKDSAADIQNNYIGVARPTVTEGFVAERARITGNGITIEGNYSDVNRTFVTGNSIGNLTVPSTPTLCLHTPSRYAPRNSQSTVCGGTGILIEGSENNWLYNNRIGSSEAPNQGYGISIEGSITTDPDTFESQFHASYRNKISANSISYNQADGIHINTITDVDHVHSDSSWPCTSTISGQSVHSNNCENGISHNTIFRNGTLNGAEEGGIGIDLKAAGDSEQKRSSSSSNSAIGTTNDTDLSDTISSNGGNTMLGRPGLYGIGNTAAFRSTNNTIKGYLQTSLPTGDYWIEVFTVGCPAESSSPTDVNSLASATINCDTDSPSPSSQSANQSMGQGKKFLCGVVVHKTSSALTNWECSPPQFDSIVTSKLVTATIAQINAPSSANRRNYGSLSGQFPVSSLDLGLAGIRYNCELANLLMTNVTPCDGQPNTMGRSLSPEAYILIPQFLGNSSEFAQNIFLEEPTFTVSKTVATCSSSTVCSSDFGSSAPAARNGFVDFRITITNTTNAGIVPHLDLQVNDSIPSNLTIQNSSCIYQNNLTINTPNRSDLDNSTVCPLSSPLLITLSHLEAGKTAAIFLRTQIANSSPDSIANTVTVINVNQDNSERTSTATVSVEGSAANNSLSLQKTITSPNTDSNPATETIISGNTEQTIQYQISADATGYDNATIANLRLQDNFPRLVGGQNIIYSLCRWTVQVNSDTLSSARDCQSSTETINSTNTTPIIIVSGSQIVAALGSRTLSTSDTLHIVATYTAAIPRNALGTGMATEEINNTATWGENAVPLEGHQRSHATLLVQAPGGGTTSNNATIRKLVRSCTSSTLASCQSNTFASSINNVAPGSTIEYRLEITNASLSSNAVVTIQDNQPNSINFLRTGTNCQYVNNETNALPLTGGRPSGSSDCQFEGSNVRVTTSIGPARKGYVFILAQVGASASGTINNRGQLTAGCTTDCTSEASISIATANQDPGTLTLTKSASRSSINITNADERVTFTITLRNTQGINLSNVTWTDTFPTLGGNVRYENCRVTVVPASSSLLNCPSPFPNTAATPLLANGITINAQTTEVQFVYDAVIARTLNISSATPLINVTEIRATRQSDNATIAQTQQVTVTISKTITGAPSVTLTKSADNNVGGTNHSAEKIYKPGGIVNYTVTLTNSGGPASNIALDDRFSSLVENLVVDSLPTGATQSISDTLLSLGAITVTAGTPVQLQYHGTIASARNFDLDTFDLDENSDPLKDTDFYLGADSDIIDEDISRSGNDHRRAKEILGAPDNKFISLGENGSITIDLGTKVIVDGKNEDFALFTIDQHGDDTDEANEDVSVEVSQDGTLFKKVDATGNLNGYDLKDARVSWARFIKVSDESTNSTGKAPGIDIDAVCLLNLGVQLPNRATLHLGTPEPFADTAITVDITRVFDESLSLESCVEKVIPPISSLPAPPSPLSKAVPTTPAAIPPMLVKTGATLSLSIILMIGTFLWRAHKKRSIKKTAGDQ